MTTVNDKYGTLDPLLASRGTRSKFPLTTIGKVVDVNDPDRSGRVKAICPMLGDTKDTTTAHLPWIVPIFPSGGTVNGGTRTYGMTSPVQEDAEILVMCLEGDPAHRIYTGVKLPPGALGTQGYGRTLDENGPWDANGEPIQPRYDNLEEQHTKGAPRVVACEMPDGNIRQPDGTITDKQGQPVSNPATSAGSGSVQSVQSVQSEVYINASASELVTGLLSVIQNVLGKIGNFGSQMKTLDTKVHATVASARESIEMMTRGLDSTFGAWAEDMVEGGVLSKYPSPIASDKGKGDYYKVPRVDGKDFIKVGVGYSPKIYASDIAKSKSTQIKYEPHLSAWTSPGQHLITLDDSHWSQRMRLLTTNGHSIIMDDTNERIYINTAKGKTWIQLDQAGMIDIFSEHDFSISSDKNINMYAKETIRMTAEQGVHILSEQEMRLHAKQDMHMVSNGSTYVRANSNIDITAQGSLHAMAEGILSMKGKSGGYFHAGVALHIKSDGPSYHTSTEAHINSNPARDAPEPLDALESMVPTRCPEHEPWCRGWGKPELGDKEGAGKDDGSGEQGGGPIGGASISSVSSTSTGSGGDCPPPPEPDGPFENSFYSIDCYTNPDADQVDRDGASLGRNPEFRR
jgi:hypothetical protein